jgi:hypothetical protein
MTTFEAVMLDGPAKDWTYVTAIEPPLVIHVFPPPGRSAFKWVRVIGERDDPPWPGECIYMRTAVKTLPDADTAIYEYALEREL